MFISNNWASLHLWLKTNLINHKKISKYYGNDCSWCLLKQITEQASSLYLCLFKKVRKLEKHQKRGLFSENCRITDHSLLQVKFNTWFA